jgi:transcriptional regulator with XRE-family HTH domain
MSELASRTPETPVILDASEFGARLALVRWHMGWNISEAEKACGISQNTWANWEKGSRPRDFQKATESIAEKASVDLVWLMTGQAYPARPVVKLPHLDSNQEPIGSQSAPVISLSDRTRKVRKPGSTSPAIVSQIRAQG